MSQEAFSKGHLAKSDLIGSVRGQFWYHTLHLNQPSVDAHLVITLLKNRSTAAQGKVVSEIGEEIEDAVHVNPVTGQIAVLNRSIVAGWKCPIATVG
jgi:hypothetical protein